MTDRLPPPLLRTVFAVVGVLVVLVAGLGACSSDETDGDPEAFAGEVCRAVTAWQSDLASGAADLRSKAAGDLGQPREALLEFLTVADERTDRLATEVEAAGTPGGEGGADVAREVQARVEDAGRLLDAARSAAERMPGNDPGAVASGAADVAQALAEGTDRIRAPLGGPPESPARRALREAPACRDLTG